MMKAPTDLRERLENLAESGERDHPPVFVGRADIIGRIVRATRVLPPRGGKGKTFVIEGAPGAGKTALIAQVAKQLRDRGTTSIVCTEIPDDLRVEGIWRELGSALAGLSSDETRTTRHHETHGGFGVGGSRVDHARGKTIAPVAVSNPENVLALRGGKPFGDTAAVVFLDEVQNVERGTAAGELARALHTQAAIPVLLVCAGLSTSVGQLADMGLSRLSEDKIVILGRLAPEETLDCARRTLAMSREWGVVAPKAVVDRWATAIAEASEDWPRHLQCYLNAMWKTLAGQDAPNLEAADLDEVLVRGDDLRKRYYNSRLAVSKAPIDLAGALHTHLAERETLDSGDVISILGRAIDGIEDPHRREDIRQQFPSNRACLNAMLRAGVVSLDSSRGRVVSPIPSMTRHILDMCGVLKPQ